jgi:hypothetical protein
VSFILCWNKPIMLICCHKILVITAICPSCSTSLLCCSSKLMYISQGNNV